MFMTDDELLDLQRAGEKHIGISLTKACPMTCSHCAAATVSALDHARFELPEHLSALFASEMSALAARGVQRISLTGGEPILALETVSRLARAALATGIDVTVVTGLFWSAPHLTGHLAIGFDL